MKTLNKTLATATFAMIFILNVNYATSQIKGWHKAGSHPDDYEMKIVTDVKHDGNGSAMISSTSEGIDGFGTYMQTFKADIYHGKRLQLSAWIKTENVNSAQMWMRLDGPENLTGFDNMDNRPIKGTNDWQKCSIVLDIPEETVFIAFGVFVYGTGTAWIDDYTFEVVTEDISTTNMLQGEPPEKTEEQKLQHEKYLNTNYPDKPYNIQCDAL
jgi:hypothetical protein